MFFCLLTEKAMALIVKTFLVLCMVSVISSKVFYVDKNNGKSHYEGLSIDEPFATIQQCVDALEKPGDECRVRKGRYHEDVTISGKYGTSQQPIIIAGYQDEQPIIDGTVPIKAKWKLYKKRIFKSIIPQDIWQLFVDDIMMTNARWPNALWSDFTVFNNTYWGESAKTSTPSKMVDNGVKNLAGSGIDATGAMAILNIGSFNTFVAKVLSHKPGQNFFTYNNTFGTHHFKTKLNQYFLEDKLEFLDQPGEWFYDKSDRSLYVWNYDGKNPSSHIVRGKNQTYAFQITDCRNVIFANMTFFATTLKAKTTSLTKYIDNLEFQSINFSFPSYSKRMLGSPLPAEWTKIDAFYFRKRAWPFRMFNCTFYGTDGAALEYGSMNATLENNLFERNDWTGAMMVKATGGFGTVVSKGIGDRFIRNTLSFNGASAGYRINGQRPLVLLNNFHHQCWGMIQNDGSHVQIQVKGQENAQLRKNWVHDSPKYGLRFDGQPPKTGSHGMMSYNVAWKTNGLMIKGDYHTVENNLAFDKYNDKGGDKQGAKCVLCVLRYVRSNPVPINNNSIVVNNAASAANGGVHKKKLYPLAGKVVKNNMEGNVRMQLVDVNNYDFRPTSNSKYNPTSVGPYRYDPEATQYWIPGRQLYKASTPVPPDTSNTVKPNRDALMWLNALNAHVHDVYFGDDFSRVSEATTNSPEYKGRIEDDGNMYYLEKLKQGTKYYWRIDAEVSANIIYKGDVWSFKTKSFSK